MIKWIDGIVFGKFWLKRKRERERGTKVKGDREKENGLKRVASAYFMNP